MMGQASGKWSTGFAPQRNTGSEYSHDPTGSGEGIDIISVCWIFSGRTAFYRPISYADYCERFVLDLLPKCQQSFHVLQYTSTILLIEQYSIYFE